MLSADGMARFVIADNTDAASSLFHLRRSVRPKTPPPPYETDMTESDSVLMSNEGFNGGAQEAVEDKDLLLADQTIVDPFSPFLCVDKGHSSNHEGIIKVSERGAASVATT